MMEMMQNMMGGSWAFMMLGSWLLYILVVVALTLLIVWLIKQINKKD